MVYIHNGILLSHEKEQNNAISSSMDGTRDSHIKSERQILYDMIPYDMWNLINGTMSLSTEKKNHGHGEQTCGCRGGGGGSGTD